MLTGYSWSHTLVPNHCIDGRGTQWAGKMQWMLTESLQSSGAHGWWEAIELTKPEIVGKGHRGRLLVSHLANATQPGRSRIGILLLHASSPSPSQTKAERGLDPWDPAFCQDSPHSLLLLPSGKHPFTASSWAGDRIEGRSTIERRSFARDY